MRSMLCALMRTPCFVKTCVALFSLFAQMLDKKDVFFVVFGVFLQ